MASKMAVVHTTGEHTHYARICRMIVDMCRDMLWELLISKIPAAELPTKVFQNLAKLKLSQKQYHNIYKQGGIVPANTDVDITSLYTILRNICPKLKAPTNGWFDETKGNSPGPNDFKIGDDIERIRLKRNMVYGHALEARISSKDYTREIVEIRAIVSRMDSRLKTEFHKFMKCLENSCMDPEAEKEYIDMILLQKNEDEESRKKMDELSKKVDTLSSASEVTAESMKRNQEQLDATLLVSTKTAKVVSKNQSSIRKAKAKFRKFEIASKQTARGTHQVASKVSDLEQKHDLSKTEIDTLKESVKEIEAREEQCAGGLPNIDVHIVQKVQQFELCGLPNRVVAQQTDTDQSLPNAASIRNKTIPVKTTEGRSYAEVAAGERGNKSDIMKHSHSNTNIKLVNNLNINIQTQNTRTDIPTKEHVSENKQMQTEQFLSATNEFNDGHFILISGEIERQKYLEYLSLVEWTTVFDFDPNSRTTGLLSVVEDKIERLTKRSLHINCIEDEYNLNKIADNSTHWVFCRGSREFSKPSKTFREWKRDNHVNNGMKAIINKLKRFKETYTKYRVIVIWPSTVTIQEFINRLLSKLDKEIGPHIIVVDGEQDRDSDDQMYLKLLLREYEDKITVVRLKLEELCRTISSCQNKAPQYDQCMYQLPALETSKRIEIDVKRVAWLEEDLDVLYLDQQHDSSLFTNEMLNDECDNFFKGGTLPWFMWYEFGAGHFDAERHCLENITTAIKNQFIKRFASGCITVYHAPGSGGTTLAQRVLWEMRKQIPCAQAKLRTGASLDDLRDRLDFLYEKTCQPILLMMDGEEEQKVENLIHGRKKAQLIVLYVKRYPYPMHRWSDPNIFWLPSTLTVQEANIIATKFANQCENCEEKKNNIKILAEHARKGGTVSVFEFGLAAFAYEFKGIEAYVRGYLQLQSVSKELEPWQRALGMLSLAYFYGQIGIPAQFFSEMLGIGGDNKVPTINDFPPIMKSLIVKDTTENRKNVIRISHFYIAKEILEQILPWPLQRQSKRTENICIEAKRRLEQFSIYFIKQAETKKESEYGSNITKVLAKTFILRDTFPKHSIPENRHEQIVSQLLQDLSSRAPYQERFTVMEQLTKSFSQDPHFFAHFGRLYAIFRPEEEEKAERCFKKALKICKRQSKDISIEEMPYYMRNTYTITYFMYGKMFRRRIAKFTGWNISQRPQQKTSLDQFAEVANKLLELVQTACGYFQKSKEYSPETNSNTYAYTNEIGTCLMFCDFIYRRGGYQDIIKFIEENDSPVSIFAVECINRIDDLFLELFSSLDPDDIDKSIWGYQQWYNALFKNDNWTPGMVRTRHNDPIRTRRLEIATLKLQFGKENIYGVLEDIENEMHINDIVSKFEENFADVHENGVDFSMQLLELDYREWLIAIRNKMIREPYSVESVLVHVQRWYEKIHTPQSRFYLFVLKSILGFGGENSLGSTPMLIDAQQLKDEVIKHTHYQGRLKYPREWFGTGSGIRRLVYRTRFYGKTDTHVKDEPGIINPDQLALLKGTISPPNDNPNAGYISLDLGNENNVYVRVFFVPVRFKMNSKSFAQERVQFNIGFSFSHGYEAYNIRRLCKVECSKCSMTVEFTSSNTSVKCPCGYQVTLSDNKSNYNVQEDYI